MDNKNEIKKSLQNLINWFASDTVKQLPFGRLREKAKSILKKIETVEKKVMKDSLFNNAVTANGAKSKEKKLQEIKNIHLLKEYITQGYIFVQELGSLIKKETIEYLLLFNDFDSSGKSEQRIGRYSLKDILTTLNITVNSQGKINLQINNLTALTHLKEREESLTGLVDDYEVKIINTFNDLLEKRRAFIKEKREAKYRALGENLDNKKISGYEIGQVGIAFEVAVRRFADSVNEGIINDDVENFRADTQAFYLGGDTTSEQAKKILKNIDDITKIALELKAVRTLVKSGYSVGARLTGSDTVQNALKKVIEVLDLNKSKEEIFENLKNFYSKKESDIVDQVNTKVTKNAEKIADSILLK